MKRQRLHLSIFTWRHISLHGFKKLFQFKCSLCFYWPRQLLCAVINILDREDSDDQMALQWLLQGHQQVNSTVFNKNYKCTYTLPGPKKSSFRFKSANCIVMIWGCFNWSAILNDQVIPPIDFFFPNGSGIFQDDNAKIHRALFLKQWNMRRHFHAWIGHHRVLTLPH